ncbi:MAG: HAMP domain-containing sensor histidine kinase [Pseudomonadota bacterium]
MFEPSDFNDGDRDQQDSSSSSELDFSMVLASSVHDMKNSLGMLLNSLEEMIAAAAPSDKQQNKHFSTLQYEASRIHSELIQLLNIYRLQQKKLPFNLDENYVYDTFEDQVARNDVLFKTKSIELTIDCDQDLAWFYDNELIGNVVHNVLINAARYAKTKVNLVAKVKDEQLIISIEDDGDGFPEFMIDAVLEAHQNKAATESTQLGLFFAKNIALFHRKGESKGDIALANGGSLGGGVFAISLP